MEYFGERCSLGAFAFEKVKFAITNHKSWITAVVAPPSCIAANSLEPFFLLFSSVSSLVSSHNHRYCRLPSTPPSRVASRSIVISL